ncbi:TetR/AcrR family transcriptional regulator C-terminal domain-containing protein [Agrococcus sp. ARC_14]|uniref:TetR/AcrR family transcriptional regulator C-terminal domain-containing protein n=1 Tax=Agrococcus sp. ARC_14 TaxID=2919927 RepID=UPI001F06E112|nr:TetR/AcrR family transcriptional regulator C-terminal domain-containing protein [Agrococcus sp. ARC_14]MCH1882384.1 TetR/AcrR family transcriptional regulator C-terminal domain-containing protein [Agrococcus sp. ARC_14]
MPKAAVKQSLSADRIVVAAAAVADRDGLVGVSMRSVGRELGVEAMSLYHHVAGKEALLDLLADWLMAQIEAPTADGDWRAGLHARAHSSRAALGAHPWGLSLLESRRSPGLALLRGHEAVQAALRAGGFSVRLAAHAFSVLDAYVSGFVGAEQQLPFEPGGADEMIEEMQLPAEQFPALAELVAELVTGKDYRYADEFEWGLELVLDGFATKLAEERAADSR